MSIPYLKKEVVATDLKKQPDFILTLFYVVDEMQADDQW